MEWPRFDADGQQQQQQQQQYTHQPQQEARKQHLHQQEPEQWPNTMRTPWAATAAAMDGGGIDDAVRQFQSMSIVAGEDRNALQSSQDREHATVGRHPAEGGGVASSQSTAGRPLGHTVDCRIAQGNDIPWPAGSNGWTAGASLPYQLDGQIQLDGGVAGRNRGMCSCQTQGMTCGGRGEDGVWRDEQGRRLYTEEELREALDREGRKWRDKTDSLEASLTKVDGDARAALRRAEHALSEMTEQLKAAESKTYALSVHLARSIRPSHLA